MLVPGLQEPYDDTSHYIFEPDSRTFLIRFQHSETNVPPDTAEPACMRIVLSESM